MAGRRLRDRSTGDLLVLMVASTVCFAVTATGTAIVFSELFNPEADTTVGVRAITGVINTLVGLLAGFLAGRTDYTMQQTKRGEGGEEPPL